MDLAARIQQLEDLVNEAKSMPLSSSVLVNREELMELVGEMKESLPEEIKQARWIVKDREELLAKARGEAEGIVEQARAEQLKLAKQEQVVERAREEAERVLQVSDEEGRRMRLEAEDYVDAKLAQFEVVLQRVSEELGASADQVAHTLQSVQSGREKLQGGSTAAEQEFASDRAPDAGEEPLGEEPLGPEFPEEGS
jgi:hypothetical protein